MAKEAETHAEEDKIRKAAVEARNQLDAALYQAENLKREHKDKLSEDDVKAIDEAVEKAKKVQVPKRYEKPTGKWQENIIRT